MWQLMIFLSFLNSLYSFSPTAFVLAINGAAQRTLVQNKQQLLTI